MRARLLSARALFSLRPPPRLGGAALLVTKEGRKYAHARRHEDDAEMAPAWLLADTMTIAYMHREDSLLYAPTAPPPLT
jgi:hypothetical protein